MAYLEQILHDMHITNKIQDRNKIILERVAKDLGLMTDNYYTGVEKLGRMVTYTVDSFRK